MAIDHQVSLLVVAVQFNPVTVIVFLNLEGGMVMDAGNSRPPRSVLSRDEVSRRVHIRLLSVGLGTAA